MVQQFRALSEDPNSIPSPYLVVPEVNLFQVQGPQHPLLISVGTRHRVHRHTGSQNTHKYKTLKHFKKSFIYLFRSIPRGLGGFVWLVWGLLIVFACLAVVNFFPDLLSQQVCYVEKLLSLPVNFVYYHLTESVYHIH